MMRDKEWCGLSLNYLEVTSFNEEIIALSV